jgi:hypothetical protein
MNQMQASRREHDEKTCPGDMIDKALRACMPTPLGEATTDTVCTPACPRCNATLEQSECNSIGSLCFVWVFFF